MKGNGKEQRVPGVKLIEEERKKKTAKTTIGLWNIREPSLFISVWEGIEKEIKMMPDLLWETEIILILKERNYLAVARQCTNRTGTIHLTYPLLWVVPKHRFYCAYLVQ